METSDTVRHYANGAIDISYEARSMRTDRTPLQL